MTDQTRLDDSTVRRLPVPDTGSRIFYDQAVKGFGVRITANGIRAFVLTYRNHHGQQRRFTIGRFGEWRTSAAREEAGRLKKAIGRGDDPQGQRAADRAEPTVSDVLDRYLKSAEFDAKADSTKAVDAGRVVRHLRPLLGTRMANELRLDDIKRAFADIRDGRTADMATRGKRGPLRVRGGIGAARRTIRFLRAIFSWAVREGLMVQNPAKGIQVGSDGHRDAILEDAADYRRLFETLDQLEQEGRFTQAVCDAVRVIALTGARRGEITGLRWRHVDLARPTITLPSNEHKGRRSGSERVIALPAAAAALIARQPASDDGEAFVFQRSRGQGPVELGNPWRVIRKAAGLDPRIGLHGLRHSTASHLAMEGAQAAEIMTALGHRTLDVSQRYIHFARDRKSALAERAAATAVAGLSASQGKPEAEVVNLSTNSPGPGRKGLE